MAAREFSAAVLLLAAICGSGAAGAQEQGPPPPISADGITLPEIIERPDADAVFAAWPAELRSLGLEGTASVRCIITEAGVTRDCEIESESRPGIGFGEAALFLAEQVRAEPATDRDGRPTPISQPFGFAFRCGDRCEPLDDDDLPRRLALRIPWSAAPDVSSVNDAYPERARELGRAGRVILGCSLTGDGELNRCSVEQESPTGYGFGNAAMSLVPQFRATPETGEAARGATVLLPIMFELEDGVLLTGAPDLVRSPTRDEFYAAFPASAPAELDAGLAVVRCTILETGFPECVVVGERPTGNGFGRAAIQMTERLRFNLWSGEGLPTVLSQIDLPIEFERPPVGYETIPPRLEYPEWERIPTATDMGKYYPDRALRLEREGRTMMNCVVNADSTLGDCEIVDEAPQGYGFGEASLDLAQFFRMKPITLNGQPVMPSGARVNVPLNFSLSRDIYIPLP